MPTASLQALLAKSIDYAGMFPPCSLALQPAFQNHAKYVWSPEAWMLNTFVLPVEQFDSTNQLPIKFTAGLHHPIRQFRDEVKTKMHGFLNVLGAAALAAEHRWNAQQAAIMLEDENAASFSFGEDCFAWREWKIDTERLQYRRRFVVSFGSCSFDEPREDLRALGLL